MLELEPPTAHQVMLDQTEIQAMLEVEPVPAHQVTLVQ
jgi:hypothetical protein